MVPALPRRRPAWRPGPGLASMRERASSVGATMAVRSAHRRARAPRCASASRGRRLAGERSRGRNHERNQVGGGGTSDRRGRQPGARSRGRWLAHGRNRHERRNRRCAKLTGRQRQVLALLAQGRSNREIGRMLGIAEKTVKTHVNAVLARLGVQTEPRRRSTRSAADSAGVSGAVKTPVYRADSGRITRREGLEPSP